MNWSFFVPSYNGTSTSVGTVTPPQPDSSVMISGNPFFTVDAFTGVVTLQAGYCPANTPSQESMSVQAFSPTGSPTMQGNLSVVIFLTTPYIQACQSRPPVVPVTQSPVVTTQTSVAPVTLPGLVSVTFMGDTSFL